MGLVWFLGFGLVFGVCGLVFGVCGLVFGVWFDLGVRAEILRFGFAKLLHGDFKHGYKEKAIGMFYDVFLLVTFSGVLKQILKKKW